MGQSISDTQNLDPACSSIPPSYTHTFSYSPEPTSVPNLRPLSPVHPIYSTDVDSEYQQHTFLDPDLSIAQSFHGEVTAVCHNPTEFTNVDPPFSEYGSLLDGHDLLCGFEEFYGLDISLNLAASDSLISFDSVPAGLSGSFSTDDAFSPMSWSPSSVDDFALVHGLIPHSRSNSFDERHAMPLLASSSPRMPLLVADINMYKTANSECHPDVGVDPKDILASDSRLTQPLEEEDIFGLLGPLPQCAPLLPAHLGLEQSTQLEPPAQHDALEEPGPHLFSALDDFISLDNSVWPSAPYPFLVPTTCHLADADHFHPTSLGESSIPPKRQKSVTRQEGPSKGESQPVSAVFVQTPVLNAHLGILLDDLINRAAKFRARNPGKPLSQQWLLAYAGQLSEQGEQIGEWRCYVIGCSQTNKRRDHILTHVGSHVDERPYQCEHCSMRFLRNNEHRRHLAAHSGAKPWICGLCSGEDRAFARQDLLKRHLKRAHGIIAGKENRPPKRARS